MRNGTDGRIRASGPRWGATALLAGRSQSATPLTDLDMNLPKILRLLATAPLAFLLVSFGNARADEIHVSSFPGGVVTGEVNAELIVDAECIIAPGAFIKGNIKQPNPAAPWNITVLPGASIDGNIEDLGRGSVRMVIAAGEFFNGNVKELGLGSVLVLVDKGLFNGNIEEEGTGQVAIYVTGSGLFNGNSNEKDQGNMTTAGPGEYNGRTKEEGLGSCFNAMPNFEGSPCE